MEKIIRKRVFYLGIGPGDERMKTAAERWEGRYYKTLQGSHGWSFPASRLAEIRAFMRPDTDASSVSDEGSTQTETADGATQTEIIAPLTAEEATQTDTPVSDAATQTDDRPVYRYDIDPGLARWVRERYPRN